MDVDSSWASPPIMVIIIPVFVWVQVPFAAPLRASQTTDFTAFAKFFFCPKLSMGLVWDLFFRHYKSRPKVDLYDTSFCELASPLLLLAVILFFFPQLKGRASATASIAAACAVWKVWQYRFKVVVATLCPRQD